TGGAPCDATPIVVGSTIADGLTIKGDGAAGDVTVTGDGAAVFQVVAKGVSFQSLTIAPTLASATGGGNGIQYKATPAAAAEGTISSVVIKGILTYAGTTITNQTGSGILFDGGTAASPTIGPGVSISGGDHSLRIELVTGATAPTSAPTVIGT